MEQETYDEYIGLMTSGNNSNVLVRLLDNPEDIPYVLSFCHYDRDNNQGYVNQLFNLALYVLIERMGYVLD